MLRPANKKVIRIMLDFFIKISSKLLHALFLGEMRMLAYDNQDFANIKNAVS